MFLVKVVLAVLSVAACASGDQHLEALNGTGNAVPFMTGGQLAPAGAFPSVVSIQTPTAPLAHCNGVIINQNHILTSCRCVVNDQNQLINPFWLRIIAGDLNIMQPSYRRIVTTVTHIYAHPQFNPTTGGNDIAVLRVANPFPFPHNTIDIATRNNRVLFNGQDCRVAGWGAAAATGTLAQMQLVPTQRVINIPILDRDACNAANVYAGRVLENMICAGHLAANANTVCNGNLGAGLFCNEELAGILSFGFSCGQANQPAVFTQTRFFDGWITQQLVRTDVVAPGTAIGNL